MPGCGLWAKVSKMLAKYACELLALGGGGGEVGV